MDSIVVTLESLFCNYGIVIMCIALAGIVILGILKYCNVFKKLDEKYRHYAYLCISIALSVIGSIIYLACVHQLTFSIVCSLATVIFGLNQAAYAIYANTPIKELFIKVLDTIKKLIHKSDKIDDSTKELVDIVVDKVTDIADDKLDNNK